MWYRPVAAGVGDGVLVGVGVGLGDGWGRVGEGDGCGVALGSGEGDLVGLELVLGLGDGALLELVAGVGELGTFRRELEGPVAPPPPPPQAAMIKLPPMQTDVAIAMKRLCGTTGKLPNTFASAQMRPFRHHICLYRLTL